MSTAILHYNRLNKKMTLNSKNKNEKGLEDKTLKAIYELVKSEILNADAKQTLKNVKKLNKKIDEEKTRRGDSKP